MKHFSNYSSKKLLQTGVSLWFSLALQSGISQIAVLDSTFGRNGKTVITYASSEDRCYAVAIRPDGKIVAAGASHQMSDKVRFALVQYNPDGEQDESVAQFGKASYLNTGASVPYSVLAYPDNRLLLGGTAEQSGNKGFALVRALPNLERDKTFKNTGQLVLQLTNGDDIVNKVLLQPDEKIVAVGYSQPDSESDFAMARFQTDGKLDSTFGVNGIVQYGTNSHSSAYEDAVLLPDGRIVAVGVQFKGLTSSDFYVARHLPNGKLDSTFGTNGYAEIGIGQFGFAYEVALQADGKIVVAGHSLTGIESSIAIFRLNPDGSTDFSFADFGVAIVETGLMVNFCTAMTIDAAGRIWAGGMAVTPTGRSVVAVRLLPDGSRDVDFGTNGTALITLPPPSHTANAYEMVVDQAGGVLMCGAAISSNGSDFMLLRLKEDGSLDSDFGKPVAVTTDIDKSQDRLYLMSVLKDDDILVGMIGLDTTDFDREACFLTRLNSDGSVDSTFGIAGRVDLDTTLVQGVFGQPDGRLMFACTGHRSFVNPHFLMLKPNGMIDSTFGYNGKFFIPYQAWGIASNVRSMFPSNDGGLFASGYNLEIDSTYNIILAKYKIDGMPDAQFGANGILKFPASAEGITPGFDWVGSLADGNLLGIGSSARFTGSDNIESLVVAKFSSNGILNPIYGNGGVHLYEIGGYGSALLGIDSFPNSDVAVFMDLRDSIGILRFSKENGELRADYGDNGLWKHEVLDTVNLFSRRVRDYHIAKDGSVFVAMSEQFQGGGYLERLVKYDDNGELAADWGQNGMLYAKNNRAISTLAVQSDGSLLAGGWASSLFTSDGVVYKYLPKKVSHATEQPPFEKCPLLAVHPNPTVDEIHVSFDLEELVGHIRFRLIDMKGRTAYEFHDRKTFPKGNHTQKIDIPIQVSTGVYMLLTEIGAKRYVNQIVRVK